MTVLNVHKEEGKKLKQTRRPQQPQSERPLQGYLSQTPPVSSVVRRDSLLWVAFQSISFANAKTRNRHKDVMAGFCLRLFLGNSKNSKKKEEKSFSFI